MSKESFLTEIKRRVDKGAPLAENWDRLAEKHGVPEHVGKLPDDPKAFLESQAGDSGSGQSIDADKTSESQSGETSLSHN